MRERPLVLSTREVQAIRNGSKTQLRRVTKHPDVLGDVVLCPIGQGGEFLWVKEPWNTFDPEMDLHIEAARWGIRAPWSGCEGEREIRWTVVYKADGDVAHPEYGQARWKAGITMARWASRMTLELRQVRSQFLQDITPEDVRAEGVLSGAIADFQGAWDAQNSGRWTREPREWPQLGGASVKDEARLWIRNPSVWVLDFVVVP